MTYLYKHIYIYICRPDDDDQQITERALPVTAPNTIPSINPTIAEAPTLMLEHDHDQEDPKSNENMHVHEHSDSNIHCESPQQPQPMAMASTLSYVPHSHLDPEVEDLFADLLWYIICIRCMLKNTCHRTYTYTSNVPLMRPNNHDQKYVFIANWIYLIIHNHKHIHCAHVVV